MKISKLANSHTIAALGLILLYPGFYLYHAGVALLGAPPLLGGFYGPVALFVALMMLISLCYEQFTGKERFLKQDAFILAFLTLIICLSLINRFAGSLYQADHDVFVQSISVALYMGVNYLVFRQLDIRNGKLVVLAGIAFLVMILIAAINQRGGFFYARQVYAYGDAEQVATYQGFARSALVTAIILMAALNLRWLPWIYGLSLVLIFVLGARSEFAAFLPIGVLIIYLRAGAIKFSFVLAPLLVVGIALLADLAFSSNVSSRVTGLADLGTDTSLQARSHFTRDALLTIASSPVLGDFGSHARVGGTGSYAHNALSAWVNYGLLGFLAFAYMLIKPLLYSIKSVLARKRRSAPDILLLSFSLVLLIFSIFAKPIFYVGYGIGWGIYAAIRNSKALQPQTSPR